MIRIGMQSVAKTTIFTMQDVMRLDNQARMNTPGKAEGNWAWRVGDSSVWKQLSKEAAELKAMTETYDRLPARVHSEQAQKAVEHTSEATENGAPNRSPVGANADVASLNL